MGYYDDPVLREQQDEKRYRLFVFWADQHGAATAATLTVQQGFLPVDVEAWRLRYEHEEGPS